MRSLWAIYIYVKKVFWPSPGLKQFADWTIISECRFVYFTAYVFIFGYLEFSFNCFCIPKSNKLAKILKLNRRYFGSLKVLWKDLIFLMRRINRRRNLNYRFFVIINNCWLSFYNFSMVIGLLVKTSSRTRFI